MVRAKIRFRHGTPTVGECDINNDNGRHGVDSTWWQRQSCVAREIYSRLDRAVRAARGIQRDGRLGVSSLVARIPSALTDTLAHAAAIQRIPERLFSLEFDRLQLHRLLFDLICTYTGLFALTTFQYD